MPSITLAIMPNGLIAVPILVRPSKEQVQRLYDNAMAIPGAEQIIGFIDTGATNTLIDPGTMLTMRAKNGFNIAAIGKEETVKAYEVEIAVVDLNHPAKWLPLTIGASTRVLTSSTQAALGVDFLSHFQFHYNGPTATATLSWE